MRQVMWLVLAGLAVGVAAPAVLAQARPEEVFQRSLFFEKDVRDRLETAVPADQKALVEWGGFYMPSYTYFTTLDGGSGHLTRQDLRLWTQIRLDQVHRVFARVKLNYIDFAPGDAQGYRPHDLEGPNLEIGYYELDLTGAMDKYFKQKWPVRATVRGGRQYIEVGRGIALGKVLDAGLFQVEGKDFAFKGFAGQQNHSEDNIDRSAPGFTHSRRTFYGGEFRYRGLERHEPYAFFVLQRDWSEEKPVAPLQDYRYNSQYYGVGSRGALATNLRYELESVWERGTSVPQGSAEDSEGIRAYAFDAEIDYYGQHAMKPVLALEYGYASGDGDRGGATTTVPGNRAGTNDTAFQGFGYVNSGLALGARFTNLQFVRMGGRLTPYANKTGAGRVDVGGDFYFLFKTDRRGPISDIRAVDTSAGIGHEVDLFVEWRITSDLSWVIRYGCFFPGRAYDDRDPRNFLFTALNFSF